MLKILNSIKNIGFFSVVIIALVLFGITFGLIVLRTPKQLYAFPSAEGYGAYTSGGRGGIVYHVKSLKDTNEPGTLRYAINQKGARTIVFDVGGLIDLKAPLRIPYGDLTIAGQTAPGSGICIKGYPVIIDSDNIIIRFLRFRLGANDNALLVKNRHNIIIDHCSMSWAGVDNVALYNNREVTMQWCIISEALSNGGKGLGATLGGYSASYHHNLFANNKESNPAFYKSKFVSKIDLDTIDFRNNLLFNWGTSSIEGSESGNYNLVNNYLKFGPATDIPSRSQIILLNNVSKNGFVYVNGNYVYTNPLQTNDNWMGVYPNTEYITTSKNPKLTKLEFDHEPVTTQSAEKIYSNILEYAGASLSRDLIDRRIVAAVDTYIPSKGKGLITSPQDVGGYPQYHTTKPRVDSDGDGLPDDWEYKYNLNPYDAGDGRMATKSGYTNLEIYLNSLVSSVVSKQNPKSMPTWDTVRLLAQTVANAIKK